MTSDISHDTKQVDAPINAPGRNEISLEGRVGSQSSMGDSHAIRYAARTDVGLVRSHNEDSYLLASPVFAVCDGMGGHAAGEVASVIAVQTIAAHAPKTLDDVALGAAIEEANRAIIAAADAGEGKPGMGCTASAIMIEEDRMAVAHVGDSRVYLLHEGSLVRITHDHSFVEELVDSGQISADEARVHPSRSVITRALGSDPDMYADHFTIDVFVGDRIIICSDGLSSMVSDTELESVAVSCATPSQAADNLVSAALTAGGSDNVTVIVVDIDDDGQALKSRKTILKRIGLTAVGIVAALLLLGIAFIAFISSEWYLGINGETVGIYQGIPGTFMGMQTSSLVEETSVQVQDLPQTVQTELMRGIRTDSEESAHAAVESYRDQINEDAAKAAASANEVRSQGANESTTTTGGAHGN